MTRISGFTIVRNAVRLCFPLEASIRSLLDVCDEVVVNVGQSEDETLEVVRGIGSPKVRVVESTWDLAKRNHMLGEETLKAMRACAHPWGIYIQADEVLHEDGARALAAAIRAADGDPRVEGLLVHYRHFYGDFDTLATHRRWYRREVRAVRLDPGLDIRPYQGAQGFRVGPEHRKIRARLTDAEMFHYGWSRPRIALERKREVGKSMYPWRPAGEAQPLVPWIPGLRPFTGTHPAAAREYVARWRGQTAPVGPRRFKPAFLRFWASGVIERLTGARVFEFRNYELV